MKKSAIFIIALVFYLPAIALGGETFEYGGISTGDTLETLKARHPDSDWSWPTRNSERTFFSSYTHLSPKDIHDKIYFISIRIYENKKTIRVSFEMPGKYGDPTDWRNDHYARHPYCDEIRKILEKQYGPAKKIDPPWMEVRIEWTYRHWTQSGDSMTLRCYRPDRKGKHLVSSIYFHSTIK